MNCETPGSAFSPLPTCCTGAGVSTLTTSELWQPPSSLDSDLHPVSPFHIATVQEVSAYCPINNKANSLLLAYVHYFTAMLTISTTSSLTTSTTSSPTTSTTSSQTTSMSSSSTSEATSFQVSASIIGGSVGGALILVILLLVLVIIIAVVVVRRKKAAVQNLSLEVLAR